MDSGIIVLGEVVRGHGAASSHTVVRQLPHFISMVPKMAGCYPGTINLRLEKPLRVVRPDVATACAWQGPGSIPELFYLHEIQIEFPTASAREAAWIYVPHDSPHFSNPFLVEIISQKLAGIGYGHLCRIHIREAWVKDGLIIVGPENCLATDLQSDL
jgi:CTP-dependent riboflavin kinase